MDEIPDRTDMILQLFGKRQGFAHQAADALPQGGVEAFTMVRLSTVLSHRPMAFRRQDRRVRIPNIALRHRTLAVDRRQRRPQLLICRLVTGTNRDSHDFTGVAVEGQPDPLRIPFVANKRPHLVTRDGQSAFFLRVPARHGGRSGISRSHTRAAGFRKPGRPA